MWDKKIGQKLGKIGLNWRKIKQKWGKIGDKSVTKWGRVKYIFEIRN